MGGVGGPASVIHELAEEAKSTTTLDTVGTQSCNTPDRYFAGCAHNLTTKMWRTFSSLIFAAYAGFGERWRDQLRCTKELPPAARRPEHNLSASERLSVTTRTRYQKLLVPTFDWITVG